MVMVETVILYVLFYDIFEIAENAILLALLVVVLMFFI